MADCVSCGCKFRDARAALGYRMCPDCGEELAQEKARLKRKRIAPHYNKGTYQYVTDGMDLKSLQKKV